MDILSKRITSDQCS